MNIFQRAALRLAGVTIKDLQALHPEAFTRELLYSGNADQAKDSTPQTSNAYDEYAGQAWVYKATSTVARSFRAVPLYVMRGEDWIEGHPVERLLAKPNPAMSGSALWERWIIDVYLAGETGIEVTRNKRGEVAELWPRQGRTVTIDAASSRYMRANGYTIKDGSGDPYTLTPEEFIWSWLYNPLSVWRGLGVYQAAALGILTDKQAQRYAASFFRGMARPDYVVTTPQGVTRTEQEMILAQIEAMTSGKNRGVVMEQGISDIKPLSFPPKDVIWETIMAMTREEIGAVSGVPGELMGDKSATYENRAEAVKSFWNDTIRPLAGWRDEYLTEYFRNIGAIRPDEAVESDFSGVEALEQSYADRLTYAQGLIGLGVTLRDANEMFDLGIPDASLEDADAPEPAPPEQMPAQPAPQANVAPPETPQAPDTPQKALTRAMPWPAYGSDEHKAMLDVWEKALAPREARMRQALKQLFAEQEKDVMRRLNAEKAITKGAADNPFDLAKWIRLFRLRLSPQIRLTLAEAGRDAMNDLNIGVSFDVSEPRVLDYMRDRENKIKGVVEKTFDDLKRDISEGIDQGESIDKIAARVQERMGPIADSRATMIARTEVIGASNGGKVLAWQQSGVVTGKRWLASTSHMGANDPNPVRDSHVEAHGQEVAIDKNFSVGDGAGPAPGQIYGSDGEGLPGEVCNCRCTMLAVTDQGRGMKAMADSEEDDSDMGYKQPTINVTVSPVIHMPDVKPTFKFDMPEALTIPAPQVTVNVPEQAAPIVNVAAPVVNMPEQKAQPAPVVNVSAPRATSQTQTVNRDDKGNIVSTTTTIKYEG